jgi:CBS domain-containing protein
MRKMSDLVRDQNPLMLPPDASVLDAARHMRDRGVGAVLVTEHDAKLVGIFTGRDAVTRVLAAGKSPAAISLREVMTADPETMRPIDNAIAALRLMQGTRPVRAALRDNGRPA